MDELIIRKGQVWFGNSGFGPRITILELPDPLTVRYEDQLDRRQAETPLVVLLTNYRLLGEIVYDGARRPIQPDDRTALRHLAEAREIA